DDEVDRMVRREGAGVLRSEPHLHPEHLEDPGPLTQLRAVGTVDDEHPRAALHGLVRDRVPGDAEPGDQDAQAANVHAGPGTLLGARRLRVHEVSLGRASREKIPRPMPARMPATTQERTTMVTSSHPLSSKWCCRGAIRN